MVTFTLQLLINSIQFTFTSYSFYSFSLVSHSFINIMWNFLNLEHFATYELKHKDMSNTCKITNINRKPLLSFEEKFNL